MPETTKLLRAVVEIGTQLRRIADAHTTPVALDEMTTVGTCDASTHGIVGENLGPCVLRHQHDGPVHQDATGARWSTAVRATDDAPTTTPDNGRRITSWLPTSPELAAQRAETMNLLEQYINSRTCPTPETHNWGCGCPTDTSALRMELDGQRQKAGDLAETVKAQRAELTAITQQRERLRDTLHEVLCAFAVGAAYGEPATYTLVRPVPLDTYKRWCEVVDRPDAPTTADDDRAEVEYHQQLSAEQGQALARVMRVAEEQRRRADQADAVTAETKRLMERRTTTLRKRAEQAEEQRDQLAATITRVRTALNDRPPILNAEGGGINDYETGWRDHDRMVRAALDPPATEEQPPTAAKEQ